MSAFIFPQAKAEAAFFDAYRFPLGKGLDHSALSVAKEQKLEGMLPHMAHDPQKVDFRNHAQAAMKMEVVLELRSLLKDLDYVFFKGALTDPLFFGGVGKRGACDVDLCVALDDSMEVKRRLKTIGYIAKPVSKFEAHSKERSFTADATRPTLDVHTAFVNRWAFRDRSAEVLARAQVYDSAWGGIQGPSPEDMLLIFAGNLASDRCTGRIKFALDAHALLNAYAIDWQTLVGRAHAWRCQTGLYALCKLLQVRFQTVFPKPVMALRPHPLRERWLDRMLGLGDNSDSPQMMEGRMKTTALCDWALSDSVSFPLRLAKHYVRTQLTPAPGGAHA